jgi:hypothetical protein
MSLMSKTSLMKKKGKGSAEKLLRLLGSVA